MCPPFLFTVLVAFNLWLPAEAQVRPYGFPNPIDWMAGGAGVLDPYERNCRGRIHAARVVAMKKQGRIYASPTLPLT